MKAVVGEIKVPKTRACIESDAREFPSELVVRKVEVDQVLEIAHLRSDVASKIQMLEGNPRN